ncbi:hypothetical protein HGRIS_006717 [Hohenbuehelia grisea]|uniref:Alpha-type protein kinase domain-containing protein n=1 Tax=Hohenbuehelia grisea TaxID=104357 RepID=A0ABR3JAH8_9AGAR
MVPAKNTLPCGGENNVDDGCGMIFEHMPIGNKLCNLCLKLKDFDSKEETDKFRDSIVQCEVCGLCGSSLRNPCGTCRRLEVAEANPSGAVPVLAGALHRQSQMNARMGRAANSPQPVRPVTSQAELSALRANTGTVGQFSVFYNCRRSNAASSIDKVLGNACRAYSEKTTMQQLLEYIITDLNPRWTQSHESNLAVDETELRAPGNVALDPEDMGLTLREWFNKYNQGERKEIFLKAPVGVGKVTKGMSFCVELFIHVDRYLERTGEDMQNTSFGTELSNTGKKGKGRSTVLKTVKCTKGTVLQSQFVASHKLPDIQEASLIYFKRTICTVDVNSGKVSLTETDAPESGFLDKATINLPSAAHGRTKEIYGLKINNKEYVAKKLVNIGKGQEDLDADTAAPHLTQDLVRLRRMATFADLFMEHASNAGAEVADFKVSDGFLIKIYNVKPSPTAQAAAEAPLPDNANTDPLSDADEDYPLAAVYLVEPRRTSTSVTKFSGTFGLRSRNDKLTATLMAFNHFVLQQTACQYSFADIQGTKEATSFGTQIITIFDAMTHSSSGNSGLGDHGLEGIKDFIKKHTCSTICRAMKLCDSATLEATHKSLTLDEGLYDSE